MSHVGTLPHNIEPAKIRLAIDKLNEFKTSNEKLYKELMKLSVHGSFDAIYIEMKKRGLLP